MEEPIDGPNLMEDIYLPWEEEFGFNGCLWVCFDEFLEAEFLDETYMKELLTTNQFETYMEFRTNKLIG